MKLILDKLEYNMCLQVTKSDFTYSLDFVVCCRQFISGDSFGRFCSRASQEGPVEMKHFLCQQKGHQNCHSLHSGI